jgi:hypothetical protein
MDASLGPWSFSPIPPWGPTSTETFQCILHQVRHPLAVITSWFVNLKDLNRHEWAFIRKRIPEINRNDSLIVHCAKYWYYWNLLAEQKAQWSYQIENIEQVLPKFISLSGIKLDRAVLKQTSSKTNSWQNTSHKISWEYLKKHIPKELYHQIQKLALRYGYEIHK